MFKSYAQKLNFMPKDGMKVFVFGEVSVFERDGIYQVYVKAMQEDGVGALYKKYEELKQMLEEQGYFDISHKKKNTTNAKNNRSTNITNRFSN